MKYKLGDKVKIIGNQAGHHFDLETIVKIIEIDKTNKAYGCYGIDESGKEHGWWVREEDIASLDYTWEDFLKAPIGTKVTFESGEYLFKIDKDKYGDEFTNMYDNYAYETMEGFEIKLNNYGKIIRIEEPTYTTVYEPKEIVMPEIEEMKRLTDELCKTCDEFIKKIKESKDE